MPSARTERAALPVQRNRTLQARSAMSGLLVGAAIRQRGQGWGANLRVALAAVTHEELDEARERRIGGAVDDRARLAPGLDQASALQVRQMERGGGGRRADCGPDCTGRQSVW